MNARILTILMATAFLGSTTMALADAQHPAAPSATVSAEHHDQKHEEEHHHAKHHRHHHHAKHHHAKHDMKKDDAK